MNKKILVLILIINLSSCISTYTQHGYMFEFSDHHLIKKDITSQETVLKIMGSPTIISDISDRDTWIYYSEKVKRILFFKRKIVERDVLALRFDQNGIVSQIIKLDISNENQNLEFSDKKTKVEGHKVGFFKSLFGNIGQVKPQ